MKDQNARAADAAREMEALASLLPTMRLVALDLEYGDEREGFVELGLAMWDRGKREARQIVVGDHPDPGRFLHGRSERMSLEAACSVLTASMEGVHAIAGHDLSGDRLRLKGLGVILPHVPVYDTARMSKRLFTPPFQAQLRAMLQLYGLPTDGMHVAGNDAWHVVDLLLAMASRGPGPCADGDGTYRHPRYRADILRERRTAQGYVLEPGGNPDQEGMAAPTGLEPVSSP